MSTTISTASFYDLRDLWIGVHRSPGHATLLLQSVFREKPLPSLLQGDGKEGRVNLGGHKETRCGGPRRGFGGRSDASPSLLGRGAMADTALGQRHRPPQMGRRV
jgi:hypothetical protein